VGEMGLMHLGASTSSNVCNSYQIRLLTLVYTLSLPITILISFSLTPNRTIPAVNVTNTAPGRLLFLGKITLLTLIHNLPAQTSALTLILNVTLSLIN